jgi:asparagine synthase (glutamine-hydrolysing)
MVEALGGRERATWVDAEARCRLGVVASSGDDQPPEIFERGDLVATCAGHLFDGGELATAGRRLVDLWAHRGPAALADIDAHFALAVWDPRAGTLALARDALGVRSLYYHCGSGGVVFASSIEALLCHPAVPRRVDVRAVAQFLTFLCVPCPQTLLAGIEKLPPGTIATFSAHGVAREERFWDLFAGTPEPPRELAFYVERVRELHRHAVASRVSDGPMAALLSGGNDSSANVALMAKLGAPRASDLGR